nr:YtcA family lipoprotein [Sphingomonas sp.]
MGRAAQLLLCLFPAACAPRAAPTLSLFGAYFPVWILCGTIGIAAAAAARLLLVAGGFSSAVPAQLAFCAAIGVIAACLAWLWLGQ